MKSIPVFILVALLASLYALAEEEESFSLGLTGGYNRSYHKFSYPECPLGTADNRKDHTNGSDNGFFVGIAYEKSLFSGIFDISFIGRLSYEKYAMYSEQESRYNALVRGDSTIPITVMNTLDFMENLINLDMLLEVKPVAWLGIILGPSISYQSSSNIIHSDLLMYPEYLQFTDIIDPEFCTKIPLRYKNSSRTKVYTDEPLTDPNEFRFGINIGLQHKIMLSSINTCIVPFAMYYHGLTDVKDGWKMTAFKGGIDIRYVF